MKISRQARRDAKQLFRSCVENGLLNEERVRKVVNVVLEKKPKGHLAILSHFGRLVKLEIIRRTATIESVVEPSADSKKDISTKLSKIYGKGLNIIFETNPALVGGLRVTIGSDVFDGSIESRLKDLAQSF